MNTASASITSIVEKFAETENVNKESVMTLVTSILECSPKKVKSGEKEISDPVVISDPPDTKKSSVLKSAIDERIDNNRVFTIKELAHRVGTSMIYTRLIVNQYMKEGKVVPVGTLSHEGKGRNRIAYASKS